jgi:hypothetical protein
VRGRVGGVGKRKRKNDESSWLRRVIGRVTTKRSEGAAKGRSKESGERKKKKRKKNDKRSADGDGGDGGGVPTPTVGPDYAYHAGMQQPMEPPMADPFQQAIASVNQARTNPRYRHLLDARQKRLNMMTQMRLPESHQTGTPLDIPALTSAEAYRIHERRQPAMERYGGVARESSSSSQYPSSITEGSHRQGPPPPPRPADSGYGPPPAPVAGEAVIVHDKPPPRDKTEFGVFLEKSVQNEGNDVFREVAFRIIDDSNLQVAEPTDDGKMALHNPRTGRSVEMGWMSSRRRSSSCATRLRRW